MSLSVLCKTWSVRFSGGNSTFFLSHTFTTKKQHTHSWSLACGREAPYARIAAALNALAKWGGGKSTRIGAYKCYNCRKPFTVKIGTIFKASHIPMRLWLQAIFLISSNKKGISSNQLHRTLGITLKSAWFMSHRIREAMRSGDFTPFGSDGGTVEVDETFIRRDFNKKPKGEKKRRGYDHKNKVLSLVDRSSGQAPSMVVDDVKAKTLLPIMQANIAREARIMTDEAGQYKHVGDHFADHAFTRHGQGEYVSKIDRTIYTNTIEGFFSIFKRGLTIAVSKGKAQ